MAEKIYLDSTYRFTDPIRFFKANDPYYFEVDNIPLKQLQENCLWLKDQIRKEITTKLSSVKRADIDELRPYASGEDRVVRVKPGRYTARINDASTRRPLAYLRKVMGTAIGDVDAWDSALPNGGDFPNGKNAALQAALETFKSIVSQNAMGMNGLTERAFTWPVVNSDTPVNLSGVNIQPGATVLSYGDYDINYPGGGASIVPFIITQSLLWAKANQLAAASIVLPTFETTNQDNGFAKLPKTENYFIKAWRGIARTAIVDVDEELTIEVPNFDVDDFSYTDENGVATSVTGVQQRIDLVFIYSKPIDLSSVNLLQSGGTTTITKPTLGIVRGAGIRVNYQSTTNFTKDYIVNTEGSILAHPADQNNNNMGFNSTSANDIAYSVRGSFPSPDDLLNIAPLISERLEDNAYELVGQSILPVAYVFVSDNSQVVLPVDVIDIRPFFRTAELSYNERAGIAAAFPQLSLANPAVGKAQLDFELKRAYDDLIGKIQQVNTDTADPVRGTNTLATGYVFGGWNFGPEGALYNFYQKRFATDTEDNDSKEYITNYVAIRYAFGSAAATVNIPDYPDWDLSRWCTLQDISDKGLYVNDYINTFIGGVAAGSNLGTVTPSGLALDGSVPPVFNTFPLNDDTITFNFVSKKIQFVRPSWLADYKVHVDFLNCLPSIGAFGNYKGVWVEKGFDSFTIYVAWPRVLDEANDSTRRNYPGGSYIADTIDTNPGKGSDFINITVSNRTLNKYSAFVVPVQDILQTDALVPISSFGYVGNPRVGLCTYPTVTWSLEGIPMADKNFLYGNLNSTNPTIALKES